jgi:succinylglutamate desuccinylase
MQVTAVCPVLSHSPHAPSAFDIEPGEHVIAAYTEKRAGPTLIVIGGLHGNEPAGGRALREIAPLIEKLATRLKGRVYLTAGNTRALRAGVRFIDHDLNRAWTRENLEAAGTREGERTAEGRELSELDRLLDRILVTAQDEVYILDLHSTSAGGHPFATVGDTLRNRTFAKKFPVRLLLGIEEQLEGTMLEYLNNAGAVTLGFEGGRHDAAATVENHVAMIWLALAAAGILPLECVPDLRTHTMRLASGVAHDRVIEVRYREPVGKTDEFVMDPGFKNFDPIEAGQVLAQNKAGEIRAPESGLILMPLYQKLGDDGFFIGRSISPFWLWLSGVVRKLGLPGIVHLLPGVEREPQAPETLIVNTRVAALFPLQVFHLLGFRKLRWHENKLVVTRRRHDTDSPFGREGHGR